MQWREYITSKADRCHGKPCFVGTRIMVSVALDCLASEMSTDAILQEYPSLSKEMILAALAYSSELAQEQVITAA